MKYRRLPHTGQEISIIGLGGSALGSAGEKEIISTLETAFEAGVNYFDMAAGDQRLFAPYGKVLSSCRQKALLQVHFGAVYDQNGKYGWTLDLEKIKKSVSRQLELLKTDYIDFGFIHCIDELSDLKKAEKTINYIKELQSQKVVHSIGLSTHTPHIALEMIDLLDMLMFSINPAYDYQNGKYAIGSQGERMDLYRKCQAKGVGISVMKPFGGGQLLSGDTSPFKTALSRYQCIRYALDRPGVVTVLPGIRGLGDLKNVLGYLDAGEEETDYSVLATFAPSEAEGKCVYCSHCHPCPAGLDIGLINKYYDLSKAGDELAKDHYLNLEKKASDCIGCGHCDARCPFHVHQSARMSEIKEYFGK